MIDLQEQSVKQLHKRTELILVPVREGALHEQLAQSTQARAIELEPKSRHVTTRGTLHIQKAHQAPVRGEFVAATKNSTTTAPRAEQATHMRAGHRRRIVHILCHPHVGRINGRRSQPPHLVHGQSNTAARLRSRGRLVRRQTKHDREVVQKLRNPRRITGKP